MTQAKPGDKVRLHYTGSLQGGEVFDSSVGRDPFEVVVGAGQIIPGLDKALPGMEVGEKKEVNVPCDEAYGPVNPEARQTIERSQVPPDIPLEEGLQLQMQGSEGEAIVVMVTELTEDSVTLDANHPLAGKDLVFAIEMVSIEEG